MALDALRNIINNVPDWQRRLEELSSQVDQRQTALAALAGSDSRAADTQSLRNKGSTESLKPKDDGPSNIPDSNPPNTLLAQELHHAGPPTLSREDTPKEAEMPSPGAAGRTSLHKQARDAVAAAHSRAKVQLKKRQRSASTTSAEGPSYRTRSMIIVYYDSYVQGFFDELVRYISSSRNMMRKAKMAAKVAQIKRMAELDSTSDEGEGGEDGNNMLRLPTLRHFATSGLVSGNAMGRAGLGPASQSQTKDVYDNLDAALEQVQSTCEHGAHQFLRDANCSEEIKKIRQRMKDVLDMSNTELERVSRDEPELLKDTGDMSKARTRRPISMRRDITAGLKEQAQDTVQKSPQMEVTEDQPKKDMVASNKLEVDVHAGNDDDEELTLEKLLPKLQYRSTRAMRNRPV